MIVVEHEYLGFFIFTEFLWDNRGFILWMLLFFWSYICIKYIIQIFLMLCDNKHNFSREDAWIGLILCYWFLFYLVFPYILVYSILLLSEIL